MKNNTTSPHQPRSTVSFHVTNCSAKDARFLSDVIRFFTDPGQQDLLRLILEGRGAIHRSPHTGHAVIMPHFHQN